MTPFRGHTANAGHFLQPTAIATGHRVISRLLLKAVYRHNCGVRFTGVLRPASLLRHRLLAERPGAAIMGRAKPHPVGPAAGLRPRLDDPLPRRPARDREPDAGGRAGSRAGRRADRLASRTPQADRLHAVAEHPAG